jgi:ATP-dependent helicase/nuclease subunit A
MSIHKSKGLEFPVVFVAGLSKEFNRMDTRGDLIVDMDLGIGVKSINTELRVKYDTLKRLVIADKMDMDSLGEEIRVLYVALTRAKEKLIMTAYVKDLAKTLESQLKRLPARSSDEVLLPYSVRSGAMSYLSLVLPSLILHPAMKGLLEK